MKAFVSLWSADPLDIGGDIDRVAGHADGFHIDVTDGHLTPQLLFGPDFVAAVRKRTELAIEVHLMVTNADVWIGPFLEAGADIVTVHRRSTRDLPATLARVADGGATPGLAVETHEPVGDVSALAGAFDRLLLMGTEIGVKGVEVDPLVYGRIGEGRRAAGGHGRLRPLRGRRDQAAHGRAHGGGGRRRRDPRQPRLRRPRPRRPSVLAARPPLSRVPAVRSGLRPSRGSRGGCRGSPPAARAVRR
ncbi:hypothetical protein [Nonomuraea dietziae]|uniref:ribulose-phosphate 3-epimerase n=1 Tax=Nonomuraea dietziae TaxID=65515 RepID=UPI0031D26BBE